MAAPRPDAKEPAEAPAQAAETSAATAAAPGAPAGFKAWLPLLVTVIVMPILAYAMTSFVLLPRLQKGLGIATVSARESGGGSKSSSSPIKKDLVVMNKLLVNVSGTMGARYLLVSITIAGQDADFKTKVGEVEPQLRDMACGALRLKTLADLEKPTAQNLIRTELITGFNNILGGPVVQDIYFTEFAIQ